MQIKISVKPTSANTLQCMISDGVGNCWQVWNHKTSGRGWRTVDDRGPLALDEHPVVHQFMRDCLDDYIKTTLSR